MDIAQSVPLKKRGVLLTVWLTLLLLVNAGALLIHLSPPWTPALIGLPAVYVYSTTPVWQSYLWALLSFLDVAAVIFLFMWKKWAFFLLCAVAFAAFILDLVLLQSGIISAAADFIQPIVLYFILRPKWTLFN